MECGGAIITTMKINDKVKRTDMFGKVDGFTIQDPANLKYHQDLHKEGYEYAVLVDGAWVDVPRLIIHQKAIPDECESCSS